MTDAIASATAVASPPSQRHRTLRVVSLAVVEAVMVGAIGAVLWSRRSDLGMASQIGPAHLGALVVLIAATVPIRAVELSVVARALSANVPLMRAAAITQAATLLNFLPMQAGTVLRARVLKREHHIDYVRYIALMGSLVLLGMVASCTIGVLLSVLAGTSDVVALPADSVRMATIAFVVVGCACALVLAFPVPHHLFAPIQSADTKPRSWSIGVVSMLVAWTDIRRSPRTLALLFLTGLATPILLGIRYAVCLHALSVAVHPTGTLVLGLLLACAVLAALPVSITPGGIGVREVVATGLAVGAGLPMSTVLAAVTLDRAVSLAFSLVAGGAALVALRGRTSRRVDEDEQGEQ
jgi:uncharacterized membrane protein YbhN (UPF0104 family)